MDLLHTGEHPALCFKHRNATGEMRRIVVVRATFDLGADGSLSATAPPPHINFREEAYGEVLVTPPRRESDIAPQKPRVDVVVNGVAHAPGGRPAQRFEVGLTVRRGPARDAETMVAHRLAVTGPRTMRRRGRSWELTEPEPTLGVPLRYNLAHGGTIRLDDPATNPSGAPILLAHEGNPVGRGHVPTADAIARRLGIPRRDAEELEEQWARRNPVVPAPQVELPGRPWQPGDDAYPLAGWGFVAKHWAERYRHAGTFDDAWRRDRHPLLPVDFDPAYWNGAHPDLQLADLPEDAVLELTGMVPSDRARDQRLTIRLPGLRPRINVHDHRFYNEVAIELRLDTVIVDLLAEQVSLLYRQDIADRDTLDYVHVELGSPS